jgi:hypothetical protein
MMGCARSLLTRGEHDARINEHGSGHRAEAPLTGCGPRPKPCAEKHRVAETARQEERKHTLIVRDGILKRMVPWNIRPQEAASIDQHQLQAGRGNGSLRSYDSAQAVHKE